MAAFLNYLLTESYVNLLPRDNAVKHKYKQQVYDMLIAAYRDQGGIAGSGFNSPDDMVENIPFWKLSRNSDTINAVALYKSTNGRKLVAIATNGTPVGVSAVSDMLKAEFAQGRSYAELSGKALSFARKLIPDLSPYLISFSQARAIMAERGDDIYSPKPTDPEIIRHPTLAEFFYSRKIGPEFHTKVMLGTPGQSLY